MGNLDAAEGQNRRGGRRDVGMYERKYKVTVFYTKFATNFQEMDNLSKQLTAKFCGSVHYWINNFKKCFQLPAIKAILSKKLTLKSRFTELPSLQNEQLRESIRTGEDYRKQQDKNKQRAIQLMHARRVKPGRFFRKV